MLNKLSIAIVLLLAAVCFAEEKLSAKEENRRQLELIKQLMLEGASGKYNFSLIKQLTDNCVQFHNELGITPAQRDAFQADVRKANNEFELGVAYARHYDTVVKMAASSIRGKSGLKAALSVNNSYAGIAEEGLDAAVEIAKIEATTGGREALVKKFGDVVGVAAGSSVGSVVTGTVTSKR